MRRLATTWVVFHAAAMTLIAAWLWCRLHVLMRFETMRNPWPWSIGTLPFEQLLMRSALLKDLDGKVDDLALGIGRIGFPTLLAILSLVFGICWVLTSPRRIKRVPESVPKKD